MKNAFVSQNVSSLQELGEYKLVILQDTVLIGTQCLYIAYFFKATIIIKTIFVQVGLRSC